MQCHIARNWHAHKWKAPLSPLSGTQTALRLNQALRRCSSLRINDWWSGLNVLLEWFPNGWKKWRLIKYSCWSAVLNSLEYILLKEAVRAGIFYKRGKIMEKSINVQWKSKCFHTMEHWAKRNALWSLKMIIRNTSWLHGESSYNTWKEKADSGVVWAWQLKSWKMYACEQLTPNKVYRNYNSSV